MNGAPLAAFAALLSFNWTPDEEAPGKWLACVAFSGLPDYEPAAVRVCDTRAAIWEARIAWDVAEELRRTEAEQVPFRCRAEFVPVVCAALRVTEARP